jgi:steroid delta-isomerase-like uncharacterized protein
MARQYSLAKRNAISVRAVIDAAFVREFAARWVDAWNSHEPDRILELCTDDVAFHDPALEAELHGTEAVRHFLEETFRGFPDLRFTVPEGPFVHADEPKAAQLWRMTGTMLGRIDPPGVKPTGAFVDVVGIDLYEFRDGRVARYRTLYDFTEMGRQLGLVPARGSRAERIGLFLQNLGARRARRRNARDPSR